METPPPQIKAGKKRVSKSFYTGENYIDVPIPKKIRNGDDDANLPTTGNDDLNFEIMKNLCIVCSTDMGENNPRQLCGKTKCLNQYDVEEEDVFISANDFDKQVEQEKILGWTELPMDDIFQVISIEERTIEDGDDKVRIAPIGTIKNDKGTTHKVWLPSVVNKKLKTTMTADVTTFMKKKEAIVSKRTKRQYHYADVISKKKKQK